MHHCGLLIQAEIVRRIKAARFYTIMCDGTTDTAKTEEEAVVIRYVDMDSEKVVVREDFLAFTEAKATTGEAIAELLMNFFARAWSRPKFDTRTRIRCCCQHGRHTYGC